MAPHQNTDPPVLPAEDDLPEAFADLNAAAREIEKAIEQVETYLEIRSPAVPAWVKVKGWDSTDGEYWKTELGYDLFGKDWHIGVRETHGHENYPEDTDVRTWRFSQSPRKMRVSAVDKLPDLLTELAKEARRTARRLREKTAEVQAFAKTLKSAKTKGGA